jgi:hypothetical protein
LSWNESTLGGGTGGIVEKLSFSLSQPISNSGAGIEGGGKSKLESCSVYSVESDVFLFHPLIGGGGAGLIGCIFDGLFISLVV